MTTPPVAQQKKLCSQGGVFCSHFGKGHHKLYRGYFFCHECNLWDLESPLNPKMNQFSVHYWCKANHQSFIHPTDRTPTYCPSQLVPLVTQATMDDNDDDDDDNTYFMEQVQHLTKLPADDFSLDTEEEMTSQNLNCTVGKRKKKQMRGSWFLLT